MDLPRIVITSGEPAGIGPDACVTLAQTQWEADLIIAGDSALLAGTAASLGLPLHVERYDGSSDRVSDRGRGAAPHRAGTLKVLEVATRVRVVAGRPDAGNASYVIEMLERACAGCMRGEFDAMVTAPVQKSTLLDGGYDFTGHTEYLARLTHAALPVMMLVSDSLRVALVTTHVALAEVPRTITSERLRSTLRIIDRDLKRHFQLPAPRLAVLGLNPHAGESGHMGREEIDVISPVIEELKAHGVGVQGPVPADTAFTRRFLEGVDVVVAMYHDQGLPVIKHVGFGHGVNVTLGLPILRTSVDHGTALSLARTGKADAGSLIAALGLAIELASRRQS